MSEPVKTLREILADPEWRTVLGLPPDAQIDEARLREWDEYFDTPFTSSSPEAREIAAKLAEHLAPTVRGL